jgi:hypothetical protein
VSVWEDFASLIGVPKRHAEAALYSERAAKATLSRRAMFGASAALAAGVAFGFPTPAPKVFYYDTDMVVPYPKWVMLSASTSLFYYGGRQVVPHAP